MKLLNHTLLLLSATMFLLIGLWAVLFYFQLLNQAKTIVDEGLSDYKIVIIDKLKDDSLIVERNVFEDNNYIIKSVDEHAALQVRDSYKDTSIFSRLKNNTSQTRLLTTAFVASNGKYYVMKIISHEIDKRILIRKIAGSLLWLYLLLFVSTILVNHFVLKKTWKPFYHLLNYLNGFRLDKETLPDLTDSKISEFNLLNHSVKNLVKTNVDIFNHQKQFIGNVSHELQTPLAIGINKLELFADEEHLTDTQIRKIGEILETFQRLSGMNKSLLLFSRIENRQFIAVAQIRFDEIFNRMIRDFSDYLEYQNIHAGYQKEGDWIFEMNPDLADILVMNLLKNAIVHNRPGGDVFIKLSASSFTIENTGIEPVKLEDHLFERFAKKSANSTSSGLGLAIVRAITEVSGLNFSYSFHHGKHIFMVNQ